MTTDFKDVMSKRTDEQLIKVVTVDRADYQPLAIEAAEQEIKNRGIDTTKIEQVKTVWATKIVEQKQFNEKKVPALTRFIHFLVDTIASLLVTSMYSIILGFLIDSIDTSFAKLLSYLLFVAGSLSYYIFMESNYQKTIGKFMTKTTVVTKDGTKPTLGDIVRRSFCRLIPFDRVSFLFTLNGFHDRFSDTTVIKDEN
ncbi:MAG: hypothetical protein JWM14_3381 [Chitinophagaceae bacterium]|nr:hypothetical protein [Chitinophagaceae bacterium]